MCLQRLRGLVVLPRRPLHVSSRCCNRPILQASFLPKFGKNIFTKNTLIEDASEAKFSVNPLYSMLKEDLLKLNGTSYKKLTSLPMEPVEMGLEFCVHLVEIIKDNLLWNHKLIASLIHNLPDNKIKENALSNLKRLCTDNKIKLSMIELLVDVKSDTFRDLFFHIMETITETKEEARGEMLLSYLNHLSLLDVVNPVPIVIPNAMSETVMKMVPVLRLAEFYSYMVNLNLVTEDMLLVRTLQTRLSKGKEIDKYILRTGELNAKWHDTVKPLYDEKHKQKMLHFYNFEMLRLFAFQAIKRKDIVDSNLYLDLLVSKFESDCTSIEESVFVIENSHKVIAERVQEILRTIMFHLMTFKGADSCIKILQYMIQNNMEIKFKLLLGMMQSLIHHGFYDEAVVLINNMDLNILLGKEKADLVHLIIQIMSLKFPESPKVMLGYVVAIFKDPCISESVVDVLNDLKILGIPLGLGLPEKVKAPKITAATVDERLTGVRFSHDALYHVYKTCLQGVPRLQITPEVILQLFGAYIKKIATSNYRFLNPAKIDDKIMTLFLNYLMKQDPAKPGLTLISDINNFDIAKTIFLEFYKGLGLSGNHIKPYPFEMMIHSGLLYHNDYTFASQVIKLSRSYHLPFTINQIYPFIIYHYQQKQYDQAESWYKLLVSHGIKAKSSKMKEIYQIARELKWLVQGFVYRKSVIKKNHAQREAYANINKDHFGFLGNHMSGEAMEEESKTNPASFNENLTVLLQNTQITPPDTKVLLKTN